MKHTRKPRKVIFKIIFSRTMITILLILVQILLLCGIFIKLGSYSVLAMFAMNLAGAFCLVYLVNKEDIAEFKLAWVLPICIFPVFGTFLFLFVDRNFGSRLLKHQIIKRIEESAQYLHTSEDVREELAKRPARETALYDYVEKTGGYPTCFGTDVTYFPFGEAKWKDLLEELEQAKEFIFLEYFIVERGEMWDCVLEVLKRKAAEGVEVRVMYDGMCSILLLPYHYPRELQSYGIQAKMFAPIQPLLSTHQNNRDHRKVLVIDGKVAYTGGVNLADEYIGKKIRFGRWKDTAVKVKGSAVDSFTLMFLQMWNAEKTSDVKEYETYIRRSERKQDNGKGFVMPYADGPYQKENVAEKVYMDILATAEKYVHIMTPYFIVDDNMLEAMRYAAMRGVEVRMILPHIPDKKVAFDVARNYYPTLLKAGIQVYEYTPGFMHAKVFTSDDRKAVVGTINLDYRSLYHHFECAVYIADNPVIADVEKDFQETLQECRTVDMEYYKKIPAGKRLVGCVANLFGPLM